MTATASKPKLTAEQARKLAEAEIALAQARAVLEQREKAAKELRDRYRGRLAPSDDPKDAGKDVLVGEAGGWQIRVTSFMGGDYFSLKDYLAAGNKITAAMRAFVTRGQRRERWTVKRTKGPYKPGSVEPG